jgi:enoyl-CoA hydratase/carnithine racemase
VTGLPDSLRVDLGAPELIGEIVGDTLTVTINRPEKRNAVTADGYHGIKRAAMIVADEPGLQFLVITGSDDVFCAGGDMNSVSNPIVPGTRSRRRMTPLRLKCSARSRKSSCARSTASRWAGAW